MLYSTLALTFYFSYKTFGGTAMRNHGTDSVSDEVEETGSQPILRLISKGANLVIDSTDGTEMFTKIDDLFIWGIDDVLNLRTSPAHFNRGFDEASEPTGETPVDIYELVRDASFDTMFRSVSDNLNALCLTQSQIKRFCVKYRSLLAPSGKGTAFLFKSKKKFFVIDVAFPGYYRLYAYIYRLESNLVQQGDFRHRVVVPQL